MLSGLDVFNSAMASAGSTYNTNVAADQAQDVASDLITTNSYFQAGNQTKSNGEMFAAINPEFVNALLAAALAAGPINSGHHPLPFSVVMEAYKEGKITADAVILAAETYFQDPGHNGGTYGDISHPTYTDEVRDELDNLIKKNGGKPIDKVKMNEFLGNLTQGNGANGKPNLIIGKFNDAVIGIAQKAGKTIESVVDRTLADIDDVIARGKANSNFWNRRIAGGLLAAGLTNVLSEKTKAGQAALASPNLRKAIIELEEGNIQRAQDLILGTQAGGVEEGGTNSVMEDLEKAGVSGPARLSAQDDFEKLLRSFPAECERAKKILNDGR
ncbi:MAG: hypothetical protein WCH39_23975 [Schlesneria sp.]